MRVRRVARPGGCRNPEQRVARPTGSVSVAVLSELRDLGYERYAGPRVSASARWRVIMRHQIASAWKTWWRYKAALGLAAVTMSGWAVLMFFLSNHAFHDMAGGGHTLSFTNAALPMSIEWFCRVAFYLSMTLGAGVLAGDAQSGAFTVYFARSIRPREYTLGKIAGYGVLVASVALLGPVVLACIRLALYDTHAEVLAHLVLVPKAIAIGGVMTLVYTVVPLGFSALVPSRRHALALWATYYLVFGTVVQTVGYMTGGSVAAIDLPTAVAAIGFELFDVSPVYGRRALWQLSWEVAAVAIAVHVILAVALIGYGVARARRAGVRASG